MIKPLHVMVGLLVLFVGGISYTVYQRNLVRPGLEVVRNAESRYAASVAELERVKQLPRLPLLDPTYTRTRFFFEACGLEVRPISGANNEGVYPGPATAWHASVQGDAKAVLACANASTTEFPIIYNSIDISPGSARLVISVLGQIQELKL